MGLPLLLMLSACLSPLSLVSATPLSLDARQTSNVSSSSPFFGEHEPTSDMMLDPPAQQQKPVITSFRALSKSQAQQQGSNLIPGITIEGILNTKETPGTTYNLTVGGGPNNANVTWAVQKKECANERIEYYQSGEKKPARTHWGAMIEDLARPKYLSGASVPHAAAGRPALKAALSATLKDVAAHIKSYFHTPPTLTTVTHLLGTDLQLPNATIDIFGYSSVVNFTFALTTTPPTLVPDPAPNNITVSAAALHFVSLALTSLNAYVEDTTKPLGVEQAATAWVALNTLRDLNDNAMHTLKNQGVNETSKADVPAREELQKGMDALASGRYGNPGGEFVKSESLRGFIGEQKGEPTCFKLFGERVGASA